MLPFRRVLLGLALGAAGALLPPAMAFAAEAAADAQVQAAVDVAAEAAEPPAAKKTRKQLREERLKYATRPRVSVMMVSKAMKSP